MSSHNSRHRAREVALQILYRYDVAREAEGAPVPMGPELARDLGWHFEHFQVPVPLREFSARLVTGTLESVGALDGIIGKHASHWRVSRMGSVDRSLIRMAAFELKAMPETPAKVVIDEAIELSKQFGTQETPAFTNGVLDAILDELELRPARSSLQLERDPLEFEG